MTPSKRPALGIDFDGTVADYTHWKGESVTGEPLPGALDFLRTLHARGYELWIFSARAATLAGQDAIWRWVVEHDLSGIIAGVTHKKLYAFYRFVDDRAIQYDANYDAILAQLPEVA